MATHACWVHRADSVVSTTNDVIIIRYRGVKQPVSKLLKEQKVGSVITWFQITSTTADPGVLRDASFLGEGGGLGKRTVFQISALAGVNLKGCTLLDEEEILIMPGTRFVVDGFTEWDFGVTEVRMRELPAGVTRAPPAKDNAIYDDVQKYLSLNTKFWRNGKLKEEANGGAGEAAGKKDRLAGTANGGSGGDTGPRARSATTVRHLAAAGGGSAVPRSRSATIATASRPLPAPPAGAAPALPPGSDTDTDDDDDVHHYEMAADVGVSVGAGGGIARQESDYMQPAALSEEMLLLELNDMLNGSGEAVQQPGPRHTAPTLPPPPPPPALSVPEMPPPAPPPQASLSASFNAPTMAPPPPPTISPSSSAAPTEAPPPPPRPLSRVGPAEPAAHPTTAGESVYEVISAGGVGVYESLGARHNTYAVDRENPEAAGEEALEPVYGVIDEGRLVNGILLLDAEAKAEAEAENEYAELDDPAIRAAIAAGQRGSSC